MTLKDYFDQLMETDFEPWLARYKEFFKDEDLNKDKSVVQSQLDETDKDYKIVITSNDAIKVLKTSQSELFEKEITPHFIGQVFTAITKLQLQKFSNFILRLPEKKVEEYINYFCNEEKIMIFLSLSLLKRL